MRTPPDSRQAGSRLDYRTPDSWREKKTKRRSPRLLDCGVDSAIRSGEHRSGTKSSAAGYLELSRRNTVLRKWYNSVEVLKGNNPDPESHSIESTSIKYRNATLQITVWRSLCDLETGI